MHNLLPQRLRSWDETGNLVNKIAIKKLSLSGAAADVLEIDGSAVDDIGEKLRAKAA
jgi:hypothetical protein